MTRWIIWAVIIIGAVVFAALSGEFDVGEVGSPSSGSRADSNFKRDSEAGTASRVYKTVEGNPSVVWTEAPNLADYMLTMAGTVDSVVSTNELAVILFYQLPDSSEQWCGTAGKPWLQLVKPAPDNSYYAESNTSMWCEVTWQENNRVSGKERFRTARGQSAVELSFRFTEAYAWNIRGKTFRIQTRQTRFTNAGVHAVQLWAGPELLAVHVIDRTPSDSGQP